jgi:hypothetical protein
MAGAGRFCKFVELPKSCDTRSFYKPAGKYRVFRQTMFSKFIGISFSQKAKDFKSTCKRQRAIDEF